MVTSEFDEAIKKEMCKVKTIDCTIPDAEIKGGIKMSEYQEEALRTANKMSTIFLMQHVISDCEENPDSDKVAWMLEGALGLSGEVGEVVDILKKSIFQGHPLDVRKVALELGDVMWYLALLAHSIGYNLDEVTKMNIEKLKNRYPNGFSTTDSLNRKEGEY